MAPRNDPLGDIPRPNIPPAVSRSRPAKQRSDDLDIKQICTTNQRSPPDRVSRRSHRYLGVAQRRDRRSGVVADDLYRPSVVPFGAAEQVLHCDSDRRLPSRSCPGVVPAASRKQGGTASRDPVLRFAKLASPADPRREAGRGRPRIRAIRDERARRRGASRSAKAGLRVAPSSSKRKVTHPEPKEARVLPVRESRRLGGRVSPGQAARD
jgi:hypothetical protein